MSTPSVLFSYIGNKMDCETFDSVLRTREWLRMRKGFQRKDGQCTVFHANIPGSYIHDNRVKLYVQHESVHETGSRTPPLAGYPKVIRDVDVIFSFDWDMAWTLEDFWTLYEATMSAPEPCIMSGVYVRGDGQTMIHMPKDDTGLWYTTDKLPEGDKPVEVATVGMGFTMWKPEVMRKFPYPWFYRFMYDKAGKPTGIYGEDVAFCLNAEDAGLKSYVHPKVVLSHYKRLLVHPTLATSHRLVQMEEALAAAKAKRNGHDAKPDAGAVAAKGARKHEPAGA